MINQFPTYTAEEAIAMLPPGELIETRFETDPNCGITLVSEFPREAILEVLRKAKAIWKTGPAGISMGFAMHVSGYHPHKGYGNLFIKSSDPLSKA